MKRTCKCHGLPMFKNGKNHGRQVWGCPVRKRVRNRQDAENPAKARYQASHGIGVVGHRAQDWQRKWRRARANERDLMMIDLLTKELHGRS